MKVTRSQLIQIIQEELGQIDEIEIFGRTFGKKARRKKAADKRRKEKERAAREEEEKGEALESLHDDLVSFINGVGHRVFEMRKYLMIPAHYDAIWGAWRHISSAERKAPIAPKRVSEESKYTRGVMLEEAAKDIKKMAKKLGYSDVGDATKKTKGKPVAENVYNYSKSIWDKLPKEIKAQFGSFNAFMEAVIEQQSTGLEIITE